MKTKVFDLRAWHWKARQLFVRIMASLLPSGWVYRLRNGIKFVALIDDNFSQLIFVCRGHEKTEMNWCASIINDGDQIIDCGANIGYFSLVLAQRFPNAVFHAIEASAREIEKLKRIKSRLRINNVICHEAMLSSELDARFLLKSQPGKEPWQYPVIAESGDGIISTTLDFLVKQQNIRPALIKIDVEGFEERVLKGAVETIQKYRPHMMIECNEKALQRSGTSISRLTSFLTEIGYRCEILDSFDGLGQNGETVNENTASKDFNMAAFPMP